MVSFPGSNASRWTVTSGLALLALARGSMGNLTGSGTITYHDYQAIPLSALQYNPPSCGMPYAELDVTRITAVQQMDKATDCGQCVRVSNANDPSKFVYVLAVDTGGRGLDLSKPAFGQILNIDDGVGAATWEPVAAANCAGIWSNGAQQPAPAPSSSSSSLVVAPPAPTSSAPAAPAPAPTTVQLPAQPATHVQVPRSTADDAPTPQDSAPPATVASAGPAPAPAPATAQAETEQTAPQPADSETNESGKDELGALMSSDLGSPSSDSAQSVGEAPGGLGHHGEESDAAASGEGDDGSAAADELGSSQHGGALDSLQTSGASMARQAPLFITPAAAAAMAVFALLC
ncbi:hypothetical protein H4217_000124 [Coemansia sp. RSA 1939]|nr:hypothetical protein H4217_000124 [Coemansia sp. RSA 1939]KAJ2618075.1 hypothetical protein EV177_000230 [Coemansia sp. RSA 1804]KAJ2693349.1 hypothetical protein GGH99_001202 [Coemansia sp. RSA 1285]